MIKKPRIDDPEILKNIGKLWILLPMIFFVFTIFFLFGFWVNNRYFCSDLILVFFLMTDLFICFFISFVFLKKREVNE